MLATIAAVAGPVAWAHPTEPAFHVATPIAAPDGRWDFASWDKDHHRLIVAHGKDVLVIDPANPSAVRSVGQIEGAHAALAIPGTDRILVTSGHDDSVRILDAVSGTEVARISVSADPDAAILSADGRTAYVMGAKGGAVSVIDLEHLTEIRRIALKPALEVPVLVGGLLAVNNEDASEIELADLASGQASGAIKLTGCDGPTGLAYASGLGLALSACANGKAALVDIAKHRVVKLLPIGMGPDTVIWQASRHRFLVPCGKSGMLSIISLTGKSARTLPQVTTETSARTAALDPENGRLYVPAGRFEAAENGNRPAMVPGSFHIIVLTPSE
jgi:DNA-binding beta-propeller fold protein YncE